MPKLDSILIPTSNCRTVRVICFLAHGFAIHPSLREDNVMTWTVSHKPTGFGLKDGFVDRDAATAFACEVAALELDWEFDRREKMPAETKNAMREFLKIEAV